jgi:hypothetical protein
MQLVARPAIAIGVSASHAQDARMFVCVALPIERL